MSISKIQFRRGTAAQWTTANPVLASGEPGYETDTKRRKVGDGTTAWNSLPYNFDNTSASAAYSPLVRATTVAYAATVTPNADTTDVLNIGALTGDLTLAAPTGTPRDGQTLMVRFAQDGTGSRTITYNAAYAFGTDVTAALDPSTASAKWTRLFAYNASDSKWWALAIARGF